MLLEHVLRHYLPRLYHGFKSSPPTPSSVTVTPNSRLVRRRDEDLLMTIEQGIRERRMGDAVRLRNTIRISQRIAQSTRSRSSIVSGEDLYPGKGLTAFTDLFQL